MFTNSQGKKMSSIMEKRQNFKAQIRRQFLNDFFTEKRKEIRQKQIALHQRETFLNDFAQLLQTFFWAKSRQQSEQIIYKLHQQLIKQNVDFRQAIKINCQRLLKTFIIFPRNRYALQILHIILSQCYEQTFMIDDKKFCILHEKSSYQVRLDRKQMTEYQECMDVLMKTIDNQIPILSQIHSPSFFSSESEQQIMHKHNKNVQNKLRMYLACLKELSVKINSFILREEYVKEYVNRWSKQLLIEHSFRQQPFLIYLSVISNFVIPFYSYSRLEGDNILVENETYGSIGQYQLQQALVDKLFQMCVPLQNQHSSSKVPLLCMLVIKNMFSFKQLKIQKVVRHFQQLMHLIRVALNYQKYYKVQNLLNLFGLLKNIIQAFIAYETHQKISAQLKSKLREVNIVKRLRDLEFISTFQIYLTIQVHKFCIHIYEIVQKLIEYCLVFELNQDMDQLLNQKGILIEIVHKIDDSNVSLTKTNLKSVAMICQYSQKTKNEHFCLKMIGYGIDFRLQILAYHFDSFIVQLASELSEDYFNEQMQKRYTDMQSQMQQQKNRHRIPSKQDFYDY